MGVVEVAGRSDVEEDEVERCTPLNLIGIHPGRGAEDACRKATVIYERWKTSQDAVKWMRATVFMPLTLKENSALRSTDIVYHRLVMLSASL